MGQLLDELLSFLSGNNSFDFSFQGGHHTPPTSLFDNEEFRVSDGQRAEVILFSGGIDSLTGVAQQLTESDKQLCLVSHRSGQPETSRTQDQLVRGLDERYKNRLRHFKFHCSLRGKRAHEETQRTRFFLYTAIAFALARALGKDSIWVYENGVTSLNFPKRQDVINGRASRTTHPRSISLLQRFFSEVSGAPFHITTPFFWKTKTDVLQLLADCGRADFLSSSVSCSKTFKSQRPGTQCGGCSQCVDRRFAAFASRLQDYDDPALYSLDFIQNKVEDGEVHTTLTDFVRQAMKFAKSSADSFYVDWANELVDVVDYLPPLNEEQAVERLWQLCSRHGSQVKDAIKAVRAAYEDPWDAVPVGSLLYIVNGGHYREEPTDMAEKPAKPKPLEVFFSYSHRDEKLRDKLAAHLRLLQRQDVITGWYDRKIGAGVEFEGQIDEHLNSAAIILLLVSSSFLDSDYCYDIEMKRAMERHQAGEARVIPVILRDCVWHGAAFGSLEALPKDGKPIMGRAWEKQRRGVQGCGRWDSPRH